MWKSGLFRWAGSRPSSSMLHVLQSMAPGQFRRTLISPTHGLMTLDEAAQRFAWHSQHHIAQIASLKLRMGWN